MGLGRVRRSRSYRNQFPGGRFGRYSSRRPGRNPVAGLYDRYGPAFSRNAGTETPARIIFQSQDRSTDTRENAGSTSQGIRPQTLGAQPRPVLYSSKGYAVAEKVGKSRCLDHRPATRPILWQEWNQRSGAI